MQVQTVKRENSPQASRALLFEAGTDNVFRTLRLGSRYVTRLQTARRPDDLDDGARSRARLQGHCSWRGIIAWTRVYQAAVGVEERFTGGVEEQ